MKVRDLPDNLLYRHYLSTSCEALEMPVLEPVSHAVQTRARVCICCTPTLSDSLVTAAIILNVEQIAQPARASFTYTKCYFKESCIFFGYVFSYQISGL